MSLSFILDHSDAVPGGCLENAVAYCMIMTPSQKGTDFDPFYPVAHVDWRRSIEVVR